MSNNLNLSVDNYFSTETLNEVSPVNTEEISTPDEISSGFSVDNYFKDVTYQAKFNEPIIAKPETKESEPSNFWMGFDEQKSDVQNWALVLESKFPMSGWHNRYSKPLPEDASKLDIFSAQELYGYDDPDMPKWEDMGSDARRIRLLELFNNNLDIKYPNRNDPDREKTKSEIAGTMLGALMTPTSLAPIGKSWKVMTGIGAFFGFEWGISEGLANEGTINWKDTAQYTALGAVAAPLMVLGGRAAVTKYKKYKVEKNVKILREAQKLTGRKTIIPTRKEADAYYEAVRYGKGEEQIKTGGWMEDFLGVVSARIKNIDVSLFHRLRKLEYNQHAKLHDSFVEVEPFLKGLNKIKSKTDKDQITLALYNGDFQKVEMMLARTTLYSFYSNANYFKQLT